MLGRVPHSISSFHHFFEHTPLHIQFQVLLAPPVWASAAQVLCNFLTPKKAPISPNWLIIICKAINKWCSFQCQKPRITIHLHVIAKLLIEVRLFVTVSAHSCSCFSNDYCACVLICLPRFIAIPLSCANTRNSRF